MAAPTLSQTMQLVIVGIDPPAKSIVPLPWRVTFPAIVQAASEGAES